MRGLLFAAIGCLLFPCAAEAQELVADLTAHVIEINSRFQGAHLVAFGAVDGGGDVVIVISGPQRNLMVRRKSRVAGIWLNTESLGFQNVPTFYRIVAGKPVLTILTDSERQLNGIGTEALSFNPRPADADEPPQKIRRFRAALIDQLQSRGFYIQHAQHPVEFLSNKLFRANLDFPANVPVGTYDVTAYLVRNGSVVASQSIPLVVSRSGFEAAFHDFAERYSLMFGIFAAFGSAVVGWAGSTLFRLL